MLIKRRTISPAELAELEAMRAQTEQNNANIQYIAMMADIELYDESEGSENVEEI